MPVYKGKVDVETKGEVSLVDITEQVRKVVAKSGIKDGLACVFVAGATGAVTTIEYEPGLVEDLPDALERLFPKGIDYKHHIKWDDGNGHSHVRASFLKPSLTVPVVDGELPLGRWQQIIFIELDVKPRKRSLLVQVVGE